MTWDPHRLGLPEAAWAGGALPPLQPAHPDGLWEAIREAYRNGLGGQYTDVRPVPGGGADCDQLVKLELQPPYVIQWLVTLAGLRFRTNPNGVALPVPAWPADNNVTTIPGATLQGPQARIRWGNSIEESAVVDWPWGGCTFTVSGRICEVTLENPGDLGGGATSIPPRVGAFATPMPGAHGANVERGGARQTGPIWTIAGAAPATNLVGIPRRATGYRCWSTVGPSDARSGYLASYSQETASGITVCFDYDGTFGLATLNAPNAASRWWPLHPAAEFIRITNNNAGGICLPGLTFMLDLG